MKQDVFSIANPYEEYICAKASAKNIPIGGTFELVPTCNMNCKMCYVRMNKKEVDALGGYRPKEFWLDIAEQAMKEGLLFLLLTGGEPLLYPDFFSLYKALHDMGIILTINTNATLIGDEAANFFGENVPRRLNITVYGKDDETYGKLCMNPKGFSQMENAVRLLKKNNVPIKFNCSLTPYNYKQLDDIRKFADKWDYPLEIAYYMMPPNRKLQKNNYNEHRLSPRQAAEMAFNIAMYSLSEEQKQEKIKKILNSVYNPKQEEKKVCGFWCRAANASFWMNWRGMMVPCGMMNGPIYDMNELNFSEAWKRMVTDVLNISLSDKCHHCNKRAVCPHCAASEISETGIYGEAPEYLCALVDEYLKILEKEAK